MANKSATFSPEKIHQVLLKLQDQDLPNVTFYGVAISLLYYGLLRANEVRDLKVEDIVHTERSNKKEITVMFNYEQKKKLRL